MGWCDDPASKHYNKLIYFPFKHRAEKLYMQKGIYDFIATDSISYDQMNNSFIENKIESVSKIIGSQKLNEIFLENPKNVTDQKSSNDFQISRH